MQFDIHNEWARARLAANPVPPEPQEEEPVMYCDICGEPMYYEDDSWYINQKVYCKDCIDNCWSRVK